MILFAHNQTIPKILCDHTLEDSAHWLRAAGYDVHIPFNNLNQSELIDLAQRDDRVLIIGKKNIQNNFIFKNIVVVESDLIYEQIKQIGKDLLIDWLYKPFSRCMICNTTLTKLNINQWLPLPEEIKNKCVTSHACMSCNRIYWAGDQVNRMVNQLQVFNNSDWNINKRLFVDSVK